MGRFDFGFGFGFGGHREQCLYTKPRATSQQTIFFCGWGGLGRFNFDFGLERGASSRVFFEGGGGKVRLRVRWSLRAMCAQSPAHHPSTPFFCVEEEGWGGSTSGSASGSVVIASNVCTKPRASSQQTVFFLWIGGVGEVRLRVRLRVRWALQGISVQSPVHHPSNLFFSVEGGLGRFDFGFGFGFDGHFEQCLYKAWCIMPANFWCMGRFDFGFGFGH